jgi:hypothetical protein
LKIVEPLRWPLDSSSPPLPIQGHKPLSYKSTEIPLTVDRRLNKGPYPLGISVSDVNTSQTKDLICAPDCFGPWRGPLYDSLSPPLPIQGHKLLSYKSTEIPLTVDRRLNKGLRKANPESWTVSLGHLRVRCEHISNKGFDMRPSQSTTDKTCSPYEIVYCTTPQINL